MEIIGTCRRLLLVLSNVHRYECCCNCSPFLFFLLLLTPPPAALPSLLLHDYAYLSCCCCCFAALVFYCHHQQHPPTPVASPEQPSEREMQAPQLAKRSLTLLQLQCSCYQKLSKLASLLRIPLEGHGYYQNPNKCRFSATFEIRRSFACRFLSSASTCRLS